MSLFAELKRRNVLRVAAAYVAVSWLLIQVVETLFPVFGLSDAAIRTVVIVLAIGFVPAVVVAWAFELTPEGLVRDSEIDRASPSVKARAKRLDRIVMVALALAVGYFAFDKFMLDPARDEAIAETAREQGRAEAVQAQRNAGPPVVAVLPFSAVTANEDSEFFAAGVHDDLLTKLAQTPSMLVVSRTSVMEYKDVQRNMREIGAALGADAILEGGVQSAGNRIRINAQLIDAKTDEHLWAETYDRELTTASIFDVQDDIALAIAEALQTTFTAAAVKSPIPTQNMAAYRAYHEALNIRYEIRHGHQSEEYRNLLLEAAELDPSFTRPMALLVGSYALSAFQGDDAESVARAESVLEDIRAIAPDSVDHLIAQTFYTYYILRDYDLALELTSRVLDRVPSDTEVISIKTWIERRLGDYDAMIETLRTGRKLEPRNPMWDNRLIFNLALAHRYDEAIAELEAYDWRDENMEFLRAQLAVREHGDLQRMVQDVVAINDEFETKESLDNMAFALAMGGNFEAAARTLEALPDDGVTPMGLSNKQFNKLLISHLLGNQDTAAELVAIGCIRIAQCEKGLGCPFGITTTDPEHAKKIDAAVGFQQIVNMYTSWLWQLAGILEILGMRSISELRGRSDLLVYLT
ncbi:MAG: glutamate synthase-related protein [Gammaproteobacteria bacterium]